jgi:hypothetical protein
MIRRATGKGAARRVPLARTVSVNVNGRRLDCARSAGPVQELATTGAGGFLIVKARTI